MQQARFNVLERHKGKVIESASETRSEINPDKYRVSLGNVNQRQVADAAGCGHCLVPIAQMDACTPPIDDGYPEAAPSDVRVLVLVDFKRKHVQICELYQGCYP